MRFDHEIVFDQDDPALGGCGRGEVGDLRTFVPSVWSGLIETYGVKSVLDLGCGFGYSTRWFWRQGLHAFGIEGSAAIAREACKLGPAKVVAHDYRLGPFPDYLDPFGYDLCWCSEFAEHVDQKHEAHWLTDVQRCRVLALTAAPPGDAGHHHVNCQPRAYWINRLEEFGFTLDPTNTDWLRAVAADAHPYSFFARNGLVFLRSADAR